MDIAPMVSCDDTLLLLSRHLDGDLSGAEEGVMHAHIAGCAACRQALDEMSQLTLALRELGRHFDEAVLDDGFTAQWQARLGTGHGENGDEQLRLFGRRAANDAAMRSALQAAKDPLGFVRLFVQLGRDNGYRFRAEQVELKLGLEAANDDKLSDAQLERVAGGSGGFDGKKMLDLLSGLDQ
jgi:predicted ribosomally synthesized peptide with nif11-like leader